MELAATKIALLVSTYLALVTLSFVFSAAETAYSSLRVMLIRLYAARGNRRAHMVLRFANNLPHTLNAIVIGDNMVNIAFTSIATYAGYVYAGTIGAIIFSVLNLFIVFVISEAWPKTLAANNPEDLALRLSGFMDVYLAVMSIPASVFNTIGQHLSRVFSWARPRGSMTTEERMLYALELAKAEGVISDSQHTIISRVLRLDDATAKDIMVQVEKSVVVRSGSTTRQAMETFSFSGHRRLPVIGFQGSSNVYPAGSVVGAIYVRDVAVLLLNGYGDTRVEEVCEPIVVVSESTKLIDVLNSMYGKGAQVASVEDGQVVKGFIFMNDILISIFGESRKRQRDRRLVDVFKKRMGNPDE
ncbi:MAG: CNNM domain-containing protein [Thermoprotei archaeon]